MLCFWQKIRVAHRMQDEAFAAAQQHDAAGAGKLVVKVLHHRCSQIDQAAILADDNAQIRFVDPPDLANSIMSHPKGSAAFPGLFDEIGDDPMRNPSLSEELSMRAANCGHVGAKLMLFHVTSSPILACRRTSVFALPEVVAEPSSVAMRSQPRTGWQAAAFLTTTNLHTITE